MRRRAPLLEDSPQEDELEIHARLENWGAWCRLRPSRAGHAQSAEGFFHEAEKGNVWNPPEPRLGIDLLDAEVVNAALVALAPEFRAGIKLRYFSRLPDRLIARALAVPRAKYQDFMRRARLMVRNHLRFVKSAYTMAHNLLRAWRK